MQLPDRPQFFHPPQCKPVEGRTFDRKLGQVRSLTTGETILLQKRRSDLVTDFAPTVLANAANYDKALAGEPLDDGAKYVTVVFDREEAYVRFTEDIHISGFTPGEDFDLTNVPVDLSSSITPALLRQLISIYPLRPVTIQDIQDKANQIQSPYEWDLADFENFRIPGSPRTEKES